MSQSVPVTDDIVHFESVESSLIASGNYSPSTQVLMITFKSGPTWQYLNVPESTYKAMREAPSIGKYFSANIKKQFPGSQVSSV